MNKNKSKKKSGFAKTKRYPGKQHPAYYRQLSSDEVEYTTFTKRDPARIDGKDVPVRKLSSNINPQKRGKEPSNVVDRVFVGKRSSLHKNEPTYRFASKKDKDIVEDILNNSCRVRVDYTSNSKTKKNKQ